MPTSPHTRRTPGSGLPGGLWGFPRRDRLRHASKVARLRDGRSPLDLRRWDRRYLAGATPQGLYAGGGGRRGGSGGPGGGSRARSARGARGDRNRAAPTVGAPMGLPPRRVRKRFSCDSTADDPLRDSSVDRHRLVAA